MSDPTSSAGDTPASPSPSPEPGLEPEIIDISGPISPSPFAFYDPDSQCWRTSQGTFPWASDEYSETWPPSGSMRSGTVFLQRPSVPRTSVIASSSSLPTPTVSQYGTNQTPSEGASVRPSLPSMAKHDLWPTPTVNGNRNRAGISPKAGDGLEHRVFKVEAQERGLWPTPTVQDSENDGGPAQFERNSLPLNAAVKLWPTPTARLGVQRGPQAKRYNDPERSTELDDAVAFSLQHPEEFPPDPKEKTHFLPTPTQSDGTGGPGTSGREGGPNLRTVAGGSLNPLWVEWLQGFPVGWTDCEPSATPSSLKSQSTSAD